MNGDGKADLIVSTFDGNAAVLLGGADGTLGNPVGSAIGGNAFAIVLAGFNGDAKLDLAAATTMDTSRSLSAKATAHLDSR